MRAITITVLLVVSAGYTQIRAQSSKADSKKQDKSQNETAADKAADKILADTKELEAPSWYGEVYPALKRKYKKPVSRELYDTWRERYFQNEMVPRILKAGYGLEPARREFMKGTEKQPSN